MEAPLRAMIFTADRLSQAFAAERERWLLWLPVCIGVGVGTYFALPTEPPAALGTGAVLVLAVAAVAWRHRLLLLLPTMALLAAATGFAAVQLRARSVAAPILERPSGSVSLAGTVVEIEPLAEGGGRRVTLDDVVATVPRGPSPTRVRLRLPDSEPPLAPGQRIAVRATLIPPPQPAMPGAFDFARHAWFQGLGAIGTARGAIAVVPAAAPEPLDRLRQSLSGMRAAVNARILAVLPGAEGAVAVALLTSETAAIHAPVLADYRDSGLAHMLSVSGMHMSLLAGLVFFLVRGGLALLPALALRVPIKKWAAAVAMAATLFYMLLAGAPVPAQRSFLMTAVVLLAVLIDRSALSMRLVAWAAVAVLLASPEALIGPSFQMSFAAVVALIAAYEEASPRFAAWGDSHRGAMGRLALYVAGAALASLVAGLATAVYGLYHFNRVAVFSLAANMLALPLTGLVAMPFALAALLLMPLGWEQAALGPLGWGLAAINGLAAWVASWPGASLALPAMPSWGLLLFTLGGVWLCLWRGGWRWWGVAAMAASLASMAVERPPDLLVDGRGQAFAVRSGDGGLLASGGGRIVKDTWIRRAGPAAGGWWPRHGRSADGRLSCDSVGCLYRAEGWVTALVRDETGLAEACAGAMVVISGVPVREACRGATVVIDRFDLWRRGAHALWLEDGGRVRIAHVAGWQGRRPWAVGANKSPAVEGERGKGDGEEE
ncbi:MAG: ComEC/Rec2 family competence protein [Magnetospirillum sp.]|nr:ComEC/Rec2 family competence protein [Magnetospirillum sp.]